MACAFTKTSTIEDQALWDVMGWATGIGMEIQPIPTAQLQLQRHHGDMLLKDSAGSITSLELKAELDDKYGNLFLEEWSNRHHSTAGWLRTCWASWLLYYFIRQGVGYLMRPDCLRLWADLDNRIEDFPLKRQAKYSQLNDTWGRCVPIGVLKDEVPSFWGPLAIRKEKP